ncbi:MAG: hypothetical protein ACXAEU_22845 [Candidatus Hodarchaeales archaeon]|jgi:hypothetical protein
MLFLEELAALIPVYNLLFFILGVPFVLWLNNKTRSDLLCVVLGIAYMLLYGFLIQPAWDDWLFFFFGLIVGYITDYWGVKSKKWKYHPWDPDFGYSGYVGFAWGMVCMFTYSIGKGTPASIETIFLPGILFLIPTILLEWKYGETRRDQYFLFARAIFTFLAYLAANNLGLLFAAVFVGSYIEWAGVYWIKNWLYIDTMSFIFLSGGYSLLILTAKMIIDIIAGNAIGPLVLVFYIIAALFYAVDTFWAQKQVVDKYELDKSDKAIVAAQKFQKKE